MGELLVAFWPVSLALSGKPPSQGKNPNPKRRENCVRNDTQGYSLTYTLVYFHLYTHLQTTHKSSFSITSYVYVKSRWMFVYWKMQNINDIN